MYASIETGGSIINPLRDVIDMPILSVNKTEFIGTCIK